MMYYKMKSGYINFILLICLLLICIGACKNDRKLTTSENIVSKIQTTDSIQTKSEISGSIVDSLQVRIVPNRFHANTISTAEIIICNYTLDTFNFGTHVKIEKFVDTRWINTHALDNLAFEDIAIYSLPGSEQRQTIILKTDGYEYQPGRYRIPKNLSIKNGGETTNVYYYPEFQVK